MGSHGGASGTNVHAITNLYFCFLFNRYARVKMYEQLNCLYGAAAVPTHPPLKNARQSIMGTVYKAITTMNECAVKEENAFVLR